MPKLGNAMEALRIITEEHQNLWRIATTLDMVADEIGGGKIEQPFFNSVFDYIDQFMDRAHHAKEDEFLFPALRALRGGCGHPRPVGRAPQWPGESA